MLAFINSTQGGIKGSPSHEEVCLSYEPMTLSIQMAILRICDDAKANSLCSVPYHEMNSNTCVQCTTEAEHMYMFCYKFRVMVVNSTFNNISVIQWRSVLWVEKTTDLSQVPDKLYSIMLQTVHLACVGFELKTLVVMGTVCIGSCKSN